MQSSKLLVSIFILLLLHGTLLAAAQFELLGQNDDKDRTDMDDIPLAEPEGILSLIDMLPTEPLDVPTCLGDNLGQAAAQCVPNTEVIDLTRYEACEAELATCNERYAYPVAYIRQQEGETVEAEMDEAWDAYIDATIETGNDRVNANPKCYIPLSFCPTIIRWDCLGERIAETIETSLTEHNPEYWKSVHETLVTTTPQALWWNDPFPGLGAVVSPVTALEPNSEVYRQMIENPEDTPYYLEPPGPPNLPVPHTPGDIQDPWPGLYDKELRKYDLEQASLLEYERFGYSGFFITHGDWQLQTFFKVTSGPYMWTWCLTPTVVPVPVPLPIPVPIVIPQVPKAFTTWDSVPEGYPIPWISGNPIWVTE